MVSFALNSGLTANQYEVSLERQNVKVWGPSLPPFSTVEEKIKKTGKTVSLLWFRRQAV
jgi:copper chaperone